MFASVTGFLTLGPIPVLAKSTVLIGAIRYITNYEGWEVQKKYYAVISEWEAIRH